MLNDKIGKIKIGIANSSNLEEDIKELLRISNIIDKEIENDVTLLSHRYNVYNRKMNLGLIKEEIELNSIIFALLEILSKIEGNIDEYERIYFEKSDIKINKNVKKNLNELISNIDHSIENEEQNIIIAQQLYEIGWKYLKLNLSQKAKYFFKLSIAHNPNNPWAISKLARAYLQEKEVDKSIFHFKKALDLNPKDIDWIYGQIGYLYLLKDDFYESIKYLKKAIGLYPQYSWALGKLGKAYSDIEDYENGLKYFNEALKYYSKEPKWCLEQIANIYYLLEKRHIAEKYIEKASLIKEGY